MAWHQNNTAHLSREPDTAAQADSHAERPPFQVIYRRYFRFVWLTARNLGVGPEAIDDITQEIFVVVHRRLDTLRNPEALRDWIYGIVRRAASSHRRWQSLRNLESYRYEVGSESEADSPDPTPLESFERNANLQLLGALLGQLEEPKRQVFALVEIDDLTVPEAAGILQIPLNTAYSRLRSARQAFEAALLRYEVRNRGK